MAEFSNRHTSLYCASKILWFPPFEDLWQLYMANKVFLRAILCKEQQSISKFKKWGVFWGDVMLLYSLQSKVRCKLLCACVCVYAQLCPTLRDPVNCSLPGSSVLRIFQARDTGVGCRFPAPGDLPDLGIEPTSLASPALADGFFTTEPPGTENQNIHD